ncbi:primosomal protein N' [Sulfurospirillum tamanense]|uniref:primosomal protein N' n=1 Tax=Sulfurospirillum tamanense TaxID=2813362 RepID=UPI0034E1F037
MQRTDPVTHYYTLALLGSAQPCLTYASSQALAIGTRVRVPLQGREKEAVVVEACEKPSFTCKEISQDLGDVFASWQMQCAKFISEYYGSSLGEALALMVPYPKEKTPPIPFTCNASLALSLAQQKAKAFLLQHDKALLFGDTGSGKTEIYLALMQEVLCEGKSAIFLMPEIGLTPQMKERLERHFGVRVAIWHSKLSKVQKQNILARIHTGEVRIVAGPRSALFLPLREVGLIVVDEEHDESYKSSSRPRYNAKDVALMLGTYVGARVVLGSATPSLTSYDKLPTMRLRGTYFQSSRSIVYESGHHELTPTIIAKLAQVVEKKRQAIVFVPTRAHFKHLTCKGCGERFECPFCAVSMSLHKHKNALVCHYCNFASPIPKTCPKCESETMEASRIGTSEVTETLRETLPQIVFEQFDRDEVRTEKQLKSLLKRFNNREIDVLVGTQMLSKGHDYHDIGLSVILGLDSQLAQGDFRAREKALALALQIAGRSGRKGEGEVILQTLNPEFFHAYMDDFERFLKEEKPHREGLYPPFKRLLRLLVSHANELTCKKVVEEVLGKLTAYKERVEVVGHGPSDIGKIAGKYRYHVLLRSDSPRALVQAGLTCKGRLVEVDMDPVSFS